MSNGFGADMGKLCELLVCVKVIISSACPAKYVTACKDSGLCRILYNLTGLKVFNIHLPSLCTAIFDAASSYAVGNGGRACF
jgi:hypothetical protein